MTRTCLTLVCALFVANVSVEPSVAGAESLPGQSTEERLVAIADIHGAYAELVQLLQEVKLLDSDHRWIGGTATLVQTGDFLDRGADIKQTMDLLRSLQEQATAAGGEVVVLLGNHEAMNLLGYRDDINPEAFAAFATEQSESRVASESKQYGKWLKQRAKLRNERFSGYGSAGARRFKTDHPPGYFEYIEALGPGGDYGTWLRSLPMVAKRQDVVFLHGGISPEYVGVSVESLNTRMREEIELLDGCRALLLEKGVIHAVSPPNEMVVEGLAEIAELAKRIAKAPPEVASQLATSLRELQGCVGYEDWFLVQGDSPIWYRGYARLEPEEAKKVVDSGLEGLAAKRFVVGHTPQESMRVDRRLDGKVFLLDTGMLTRVYKGRASALEFIGDQVTAIYVGERVPLEGAEGGNVSAAHRGSVGLDGTALRGMRPPGIGSQNVASLVLGMSYSSSRRSTASTVGVGGWAGAPTELELTDAGGEPLPFATPGELVAFLAKGSVEFGDKTDTGINRPRRAKVTSGGVTVDAVFRTVDSMTPKFRTKSGKILAYLRDTYRYEPAVYRLSELLGLDRVPPAVLRTISGKRGSLQVWMHGMVDEESRLESKHQPTDRTRWRRQIAEHKLFDRLIGNVDRNQGNLLVDLDSEKIWLIDHTRAFAEFSEPEELHKVTRCERSIYQALKKATEPEVRSLMEPYLLTGEVDALWSRWTKIVDRLDSLLREYGEKTILYTESG